MVSTPSHDIQSFQTTLRSAMHIIAIAGAGLSAASGVPTFRGAGGMWRKYDAMSLATPGSFKKNPSLGSQGGTQPRSFRFGFIFPTTNSGNPTFTLITQNVDGLSARALEQVLSSPVFPSDTSDDQPKMLEMHGKLFDVKCTSRTCGHTEFNTASPICASLAGTEKLIAAGDTEHEIQVTDLPRCSKCNALARPGVVWFDETPVHLDVIGKLVDQADLCLVVGTSSTVYPAAGYASDVKENGGKVGVFNLEHSAGDEEADFLFLGPCEEMLPKALGLTS